MIPIRSINQIRVRLIFCLASLAAIILSSCQRAGEGDERARAQAGAPLVYTANDPLRYFADRIGGDRIVVVFPAPANVDPAEWMPDDAVIRAFQQADLILLNGAGYESWASRVSLPAAATVNTGQHFQDRFLETPDAVTHSHGPDGLHSHAGIAFTTWLDPLLSIEHARAVRDALTRLLPEHSESFAVRFASLAADLTALDAAFERVFAQQAGEPLLASHPVYQYLEARYQLNLESLHWEPDEMPDEEEWAALDRLLADHPAQWILWEDEPLPEIAGLLEARGVIGVPFLTGAQPPGEGDYLTVMRQNAERLQAAFAPQ